MNHDDGKLLNNQDLLEKRVHRIFRELEISETSESKAMAELEPLKTDKPETYLHSLRCAASGYKIIEALLTELGVDNPNAGFLGSLLHDTGKIDVPKEILEKKELTKKDRDVIKKHPLYTYRRLHNKFRLSSLMGLKHHNGKKESYPSKEEIAKLTHNEPTTLLNLSCRLDPIDSIADVYDSLLMRKNNKYRMIPPRKSRKYMLREIPAYEELINLLYKKKVLGGNYVALLGLRRL
ncbi:MAG TPA: HD domain-containing protein [Candidatus Nanoarchaeia archaeon]|nr:HD domain-containing protein [Candidatus Nanoarchaeia archaeon]